MSPRTGLESEQAIPIRQIEHIKLPRDMRVGRELDGITISIIDPRGEYEFQDWCVPSFLTAGYYSMITAPKEIAETLTKDPNIFWANLGAITQSAEGFSTTIGRLRVKISCSRKNAIVIRYVDESILEALGHSLYDYGRKFRSACSWIMPKK